MFLFLFGGLAFVAVSASLIARGARLGPARADMLTLIASYGIATSDQSASPAQDTTRSSLGAVASLLGTWFSGRLPWFTEERARKALLGAGMYTTEPRRFLGYRILSGLGLSLLWVLGSPAPAPLLAAGAIGIAAVGLWLPMLIVNRRGRSRLEQIEYELPELVDLLVVTLEAGISFAGSMQLAAERVRGPLGEELRLSLQEQRMGLSVTDALRNMMQRADTPSVRSFVRSILQGEQLGVSTGQIMRNLAGEMRKRRRSAAEERAQKAPVKLLFPLIFLMFPAMFVILLGPAAFRFAESFPG
jgi:tight adherence protein C